MNLTTEPDRLVHLGCGPYAVPGHWEDYDGSWNAKINLLPSVLRRAIRFVYGLSGRQAVVYPPHVRYLDLHRRLPFPDGTVTGIYASHVWEHLYFEDAVIVTRECLRVLRPGGIIRLVVPDLRRFCEDYLSAGNRPEAAFELHRKLLFRETRREASRLLQLYSAIADLHSHKFMYDPAALGALLKGAGFTQPELRGYLESALPYLAEVESRDRIENGAGFAMEARKTG